MKGHKWISKDLFFSGGFSDEYEIISISLNNSPSFSLFLVADIYTYDVKDL